MYIRLTNTGGFPILVNMANVDRVEQSSTPDESVLFYSGPSGGFRIVVKEDLETIFAKLAPR